jgi:hypothetical protein
MIGAMNVNISIHGVEVPLIHALKPQNAGKYEIILQFLALLPDAASDACFEDGAHRFTIADLFGNPEAPGWCSQTARLTTHTLGGSRYREAGQQAIAVKDKHLLATHGYNDAFHHAKAGDMTNNAL